MTDIVLIHGTGSTAAGWDRFRPLLESAGISTYAVELPNDQPDLPVEGYAAAIVDQVGALDRPVTLAHSASGLLLPAAARALGARLQLWYAAWIPDPAGASLVEEVQRDPAGVFDPDWLGKDPVTDDDVAREFLFHDCDQETVAWALTKRRHFVPTAVYESPVELAPEIPSAAIVAARDRTIQPDWQRRTARERLGVEPVELETGHCPHVTHPKQLADIVERLVRVP